MSSLETAAKAVTIGRFTITLLSAFAAIIIAFVQLAGDVKANRLLIQKMAQYQSAVRNAELELERRGEWMQNTTSSVDQLIKLSQRHTDELAKMRTEIEILKRQ